MKKPSVHGEYNDFRRKVRDRSDHSFNMLHAVGEAFPEAPVSLRLLDKERSLYAAGR
jgi:hypothetical protein